MKERKNWERYWGKENPLYPQSLVPLCSHFCSLILTLPIHTDIYTLDRVVDDIWGGHVPSPIMQSFPQTTGPSSAQCWWADLSIALGFLKHIPLFFLLCIFILLLKKPQEKDGQSTILRFFRGNAASWAAHEINSLVILSVQSSTQIGTQDIRLEGTIPVLCYHRQPCHTTPSMQSQWMQSSPPYTHTHFSPTKFQKMNDGRYLTMFCLLLGLRVLSIDQ